MDVLSMIKQSLWSDNSNPISSYFVIGRQAATAGPQMIWKIYDATRISDKKPASVFLFEKKLADKLHKPKRREMVCEVLRREVSRLMRYRHPRLLRVLHPIEECQDSLAFASEPIATSLANLLGNHDKLPPNVSTEIKSNSFLDIEMKYGTLQIATALAQLHNTDKLLHNNVCPQSVLITRRGMWKLAGLGFSLQPVKSGSEIVFACPPWSAKLSKMTQPELDYTAPEIQRLAYNSGGSGGGGEVGGAMGRGSDMFSLGLLICCVYAGGKSLIQSSNSPVTYVKQVEQIADLFAEISYRLPVQLVESVQRLLSLDPQYRPTAEEFIQCSFFDDPVIRCVQSLDAIDAKDLSQKCDYFNKLSHAIPQFPDHLLYASVFPTLMDQLEQPDMLMLILPSLISLIRHSSIENYRQYIQAEFRTVLSMNRPLQATIYLFDKLEVILAKSSEEDVRSDVVPMIFTALESNSIPGQEASIRSFSIMQKYMDEQTIKKVVLPKAKALFLKATTVQSRINALTCIDRLLDCLDKMVIIDELIPFLADIQCSDVDITMAVIGIYKHMLSDRRYGLTCNLLATKVLPTLVPHSVSPGLNIVQFNVMMDVLQAMLSQIDSQRRTKMISELPDSVAIERRSSLQQMYADRLSNGPANDVTGVMRQGPDDVMTTLTRTTSSPRRSSRQGSLSSTGSGCSIGKASPRTSIDARYEVSMLDPEATAIGNRYLLTVDEAQYSRYSKRSYNRYGSRQAPSTPELLTKGASRESLGPDVYKKHSSFQGIGTQEKAELDKFIRDRRASLAPQTGDPNTPSILVSDYEQQFFFGPNRRASVVAGGIFSSALPTRRGRRESLLTGAGSAADDRSIAAAINRRRSSFQGICETAVRSKSKILST